jgi:HK97 family phage major capsid protein
MGTNVYLKSKVEERTSQAAVLQDLQDTASKEKRDLTEAERKTFDSIVGRLAFLDAEIERITKAEQGAAKFVEVYGAHTEAAARSAAAREAAERERAAAGPTEERSRSWGEAFTQSEQFKAYSGHGTSQPFKIEESRWLEERDNPVTTGIANGDLTPAMMWRGPTEPRLRTPVLDVIGRVPTTMGSVEYYYWFSHDPNGDPAMAGVVPEGDLKPEMPLDGELKSIPIDTFAWWKGITRQALEDIPMIRSIVDTQLRQGVIRRISYQAAAALTSDTNIPEVGNASLLAAIRQALATIDDEGFTANAVLLNAADWADMDLEVLAAGLVPPDINTRFWGLRPVAVPGLATGTAYVGDFTEGVTFFDRTSTSLIMTDSHADFFLRNKLVLLAEARGNVVVTNAAALVKCTGGAGGDGGDGTRGAPVEHTQGGGHRTQANRPARSAG